MDEPATVGCRELGDTIRRELDDDRAVGVNVTENRINPEGVVLRAPRT